MLHFLFSLQDSFNGCSRQWIRGLCQPVTQWRRQYVSLGYVSSKCSSQSCKQQQDLYDITFLTSFLLNSFVQEIRVVWFHLVCVQSPAPLRFFLGGGRGICTQARFHPFGLSCWKLSTLVAVIWSSFEATFFVKGNRNQVMCPCNSNFSSILQYIFFWNSYLGRSLIGK